MRRLTAVVSLACLFLLLPAAGLAQTPVIRQIIPDHGIAGWPDTELRIIGTGFIPTSGGTPPKTVVYWWVGPSLDQISPSSVTETEIRVIVPAFHFSEVDTVQISVFNNPVEQESNRVPFEIRPPDLKIITDSPLPTGVVNDPYLVTLEAADGIPPYEFQPMSAPPPGLTLFQDGLLTGSPTQAGSYQFGVRVIDAQQNEATKTFDILINPPLDITTPSTLPAGTVGQPYSIQLQAIGGVPPYTWGRVAGVFPPGLFITGGGEIRGTPSEPGAYRVTVRVTDSENRTDSQEFEITINAPGSALQITTASPLPDASLGQPYSQTLEATGGTLPYQWSLVEGSLPPGLSFGPDGVIAGTPTATGTFSLLIGVQDAAQATATKTFVLSVVQAPLQITTGSPLPGAIVGEAYSVTIEATGGTPPYSWSQASGALPPGITFNQDGTLSGAPTQAGSYSFGIVVTDAVGETDSRTFVLTVAPPPLSIVTGSALPDGTVGMAYSVSLEATGGSPPYTWSILSGALPDGLSMGAAGVITGNPQAAGTFSFQVRVRDTAGGSDEKGFTIVVGLPPLQSDIIGLPDETDPAQPQTAQVTLSQPYPTDITGTLTLTFTPDATVPADDPAVQFATGGRTAQFTILAGMTTAQFGSANNIGVQTGSVAGRIEVTARFTANGEDITPDPAPVQVMTVRRAAPVIQSVRIVRTTGGFEVRVVGLSSPRDMSQAVFQFTARAGANLETTQVTVDLGSVFSNWYQGEQSFPFGSTFEYVQPFTIQGDSNAVANVSVTLTNSSGTSQPASANF